MKHIALFIVTVCTSLATLCCYAEQNYSNTEIHNKAGTASLMTIAGKDGTAVAKLYVTGKDIRFGANQVMLNGAGYIKALPGKFATLKAVYRFQNKGEEGINFDVFSIQVKRIDWADDGHTTRISGISPIASTLSRGKLRIKSDISHPTIKQDGALVLNVEKLGSILVDYRFGGLGGKITRLGPMGELIGDPVILFDDTSDTDPHNNRANALTGKWNLSIALTGTQMSLTLQLRQTGTNVIGTATGNCTVKGAVEGKKFAFTVTEKGAKTGVHYIGKVVDKDTLKGKVDLLSLGSGKWTAKRIKKTESPQQEN